MEITEVKVFPVREEKVKAFVSIILDRCFMVNDIKIIQGRDGLFISMPSRRKRNGKFKDVAHPLNNETRSWMEKRILGEYERLLGNGDEREPEREARPVPAEAEKPVEVEKPAEAQKPTEARKAVDVEKPAEKATPQAGESAVADASGAEPAPVSPPEQEAAPTEPAPPPAQPAEPAEPAKPAADERTLDEVAEEHLKDSFWTT